MKSADKGKKPAPSPASDAPAPVVDLVERVNIPWSNLPPVFAAALIDAQSRTGVIPYDSYNNYLKHGFASAAAVVDAAVKILNSCGIGFMVTGDDGRLDKSGRHWGIEMMVHVFHRSGVALPTFTTWVPVDEKGKLGIGKSYCASKTTARKYVCASLLNLSWAEKGDLCLDSMPESEPEPTPQPTSAPAKPRLVAPADEPVRKPDVTPLEEYTKVLAKKHIEVHGQQLRGRVELTWKMSCKRAGLIGEPLKPGDDPVQFYLLARYLHNSIDNERIILGWEPNQGRISHHDAARLTDAELTDSLGVTLECAPWGQVAGNTATGCGADDEPPPYEENPFVGIQES